MFPSLIGLNCDVVSIADELLPIQPIAHTEAFSGDREMEGKMGGSQTS
jgi:hypothetical protein